MAFFQTYSFKKRQQKIYFDSDIFIEFLICLCSNVSNILFIIATTLTLYIYLLLKTQRTVSVMPPISQQPMINFFFVLAFLLKVSLVLCEISRKDSLIIEFSLFSVLNLARKSDVRLVMIYFSLIGNGQECLSTKLH